MKKQVSQLAVEIEELDLDTTVLKWAMYQFGGAARIANMHDQARKHLQAETNKNNNSVTTDKSQSDTI